MKIIIGFMALLAANLAVAHGGGIDSNGGHNNRKTGQYHCHREPCISNHGKSDAALREAKAANRAYSSLYNRKDWPHWVDYDRDCQDARAEVLISSSSTPVKFKRSKGCVVSQGRWFDPYTGRIFTAAGQLDIDHIVPLKEAHISGASAWNREQRRKFANDPANLIAVSASENREKGARDPARWLPDTLGYRCEYVRRWQQVKSSYSLRIDPQEAGAIRAVLAGCS